MPILTQVGRRHPAQRVARAAIYTVLALGAVTIVYPILVVLGQTVSDLYDLRDNTVVPRYLYNRNELALKYVFGATIRLQLMASRHHRNTWTNQMRMREDEAFYDTRPAEFAGQGLNLDAWERIVADLDAFKQTRDPDGMPVRRFRIEDWYRPFLRQRYERRADALLEDLQQNGGKLPGWLVRGYTPAERRRILRSRERLGVAILNHEMRSDYRSFYDVEVPRPENFLMPVWRPDHSPRARLWHDFKVSLPPSQKMIINSDAYWHDYLIARYRKIDALNAAWHTTHNGFYELRMPLSPPRGRAMRADWDTFVVRRWPRRLLRIPQRFVAPWRAYVRRRLLAKFADSANPEKAALDAAGRMLGKPLAAWSDFPLPERRPEDETLSRYWCEFSTSGAVPAEAMVLEAPELLFRTFLEKRYAAGGKDKTTALTNLNTAWHTRFKDFSDVPLPVDFADYAQVRFHPWRLRRLFITESYKRVFQYLMGRGRAVQNTVILVVLSLLAALTINPIAAYSLSRFSMRHSHRILIFFLATMAFPPEVAMIPNFLLLRDLGLLNTFAALILPRMANGFAIFLLKGFFDSLPQELYEAAEMDGAGELQVFRLVALPLIKPIMAYIGLTTFVAAYSSFMWAFVICPKQSMWTLMVWVYDFQMRNPGNNYVLAATTLVSIPPLLVFLFANRIIMRGIIIPTMK